MGVGAGRLGTEPGRKSAQWILGGSEGWAPSAKTGDGGRRVTGAVCCSFNHEQRSNATMP